MDAGGNQMPQPATSAADASSPEADGAVSHPMGLQQPPTFPCECSICLEPVWAQGPRSTARLQCGHPFHLDCISSAFNAKGGMQCPNGQYTEEGNWALYDDDPPVGDFDVDSLVNEDTVNVTNNPNISESPPGYYSCPYHGFSHQSSMLGEDETREMSCKHCINCGASIYSICQFLCSDVLFSLAIFMEDLELMGEAAFGDSFSLLYNRYPCPYLVLHALCSRASTAHSPVTGNFLSHQHPANFEMQMSEDNSSPGANLCPYLPFHASCNAASAASNPVQEDDLFQQHPVSFTGQPSSDVIVLQNSSPTEPTSQNGQQQPSHSQTLSWHADQLLANLASRFLRSDPSVQWWLEALIQGHAFNLWVGLETMKRPEGLDGNPDEFFGWARNGLPPLQWNHIDGDYFLF